MRVADSGGCSVRCCPGPDDLLHLGHGPSRAGRLRWLLASGDERDAEILALRHQVLVLQRQINRPRFTDTDRTILALVSSVFDRSRLAEIF